MSRLPAGLLHARVLDGRGGAHSLDAAALEAWTAADGVLWVHLDYTDAGSRAWLEEQAGIPVSVTDSLLTLETRPRASRLADGLLVYLRGVNLQPGADPEDMIAIRLWVTPERVISSQRRSLLSVADCLDALDTGAGPGTAGGLVADLSDRLTWYMEDVIARIEDQVSSAEDLVRVAAAKGSGAGLTDLRRQCSVLRRYMAPQREALAVLQDHAFLDDDARLLVREAGDRLLRLLEDLDSAREHASIAMEELAAVLSEQLNRRLYVLAIITGMFLPLSFLTGMFGMNLGGIPGADSDQAFAWFCVLMLGLIVAMTLFLKRNRWL